MEDQQITKLDQLDNNRFYRVADLQSILKNIGLNYSTFSIRDAETWKCLNYACGKRHNEEVSKCSKCSGPVRAPLIASPRSVGGGKGPGHRRYTGSDIKRIVAVFQQRT